MQIGIGCFLIFLVMAGLMYTRRISALLALPIMAIFMSFIAGIPGQDILKDVVNGGILKLHSAYTTTMIGAIFADLINKHGIAKTMVRFVAEFSGDSPFILGLLMTAITALLFSSLGGLGAVIMVGTVVLPVMLSLSIPAPVAGGLFLFGINLGGMFNLANWVLYKDVLGVNQSEIINFVLPFSLCLAVIVITFLTVELKKIANLKYAIYSLLCLSALFTIILTNCNSCFLSPTNTNSHIAGSSIESWTFSFSLGLLLLLVLYAGYRHAKGSSTLPAIACIAPAIPLIFVLGMHWDIVSAFLIGIIFTVLTTWKRDSISVLTRSIIEGAQSVIPAVILMMGIGMLLASVMHKNIASALSPLLAALVPTHAIAYLITFTLLAPLALYRGPLSLWGMGSGLVVLIQKASTLSAQAVMSMLLSVGQLQGISDPTNTHNVWIATYLGLDAQVLLKRTAPYAFLAVICGLCLSIILGFVKY